MWELPIFYSSQSPQLTQPHTHTLTHIENALVAALERCASHRGDAIRREWVEC